MNFLYIKVILNGDNDYFFNRVIGIYAGKGVSDTHTFLDDSSPSCSMSRCNSFSCAGSTVEGAPDMRQEAEAVFGKAMTSRSEVAPTKIMTSRSNPKAMPPCGGVP